MARGESGKKVARAARVGGTSGSGERRPIGYPIALTFVLVLGLLLVVWSRNSREATSAPRVGDHWHSAYDIYVCEDWRGKIVNEADPNGIHTHGDGLMHIHPFNSEASGKKADFGEFFGSYGGSINDSSLQLDTGEVISEGEDCNGQPTVLKVARFDAQDRDREPEIITEEIANIRYLKTLEAFTIAFVPEDVDPPALRPERYTFLETVDPRAIQSDNLNVVTTTSEG